MNTNDIDYIEIIQLEPWHFKVRSSDKRRYYDAIHRRDESFSCNCKGFKYNGECRHIKAIKVMVE